MAEYYYKLAIDSIETVQHIVEGRTDTPLQLNDQQCKVLAQELAEISVYLQENTSGEIESRQHICQIVLLHLCHAIKKAELLVEKCCCKNSESWLLAAMTLVEIQEDFAAIILNLHQWLMVLDFATRGGSCDENEELLMVMEENYQELYKKLRRSNHVLQQAAVEDKRMIFSKLARVQESENGLEYLRAIHLQSWLAQFGDETQVTDLSVQQKLIKYEEPQLLGKGGCGTVLLVTWLGVPCALKILNVNDKREATILRGLLHPNIIRFYQYWEAPAQNPKSHLLMELMTIDLSVYIESRLGAKASSSTQQNGEREENMPFSLPVAIDIMLQLAQAMQYLHDRHLTHRDLKTSNILVRQVSEGLSNFCAEGYLDIKLADFGLAKAYDNTSTSQRHTINTGTPIYGAPEIFGKDLATVRNFPPMADVWSFGVTCAEILSGKKPYENELRSTLQTRIAKGNLRPTLPKLCPPYWAWCIRGCWEFQPKRRPDFTSICRMLRHARLLTLNITKLDDTKSCMGYVTRNGYFKGLPESKSSKVGIPSRVGTILQTSFKYLKLSTKSRFREIPDDRGRKVEKEVEKEVEVVEVEVEVEVEEVEKQVEKERRKLVFLEGCEYSFDLEDLLRASAEVLRRGSVSTAYKAALNDGVVVVKRLRDMTTSKKEFERFIHIVGKLQHRNLVPLRAYYFSKDTKLLVYDYKTRGSLSALLHGNRDSSRRPLDWVSRVRIAIGAARGLAYLHAQGAPTLVHGNIKSSNILLHPNLEACISDFGLVHLLISTAAASRVVGYRAPEITETWKVTQKSDVYSFGVVLLELLTGKAPTQELLNNEGIDLPLWVQSVVREEWTTEVFDLSLMRYQNVEEEMVPEMVAMLQLAMQCVDVVPDRRPNMSDLLPLLENVHPFSPPHCTDDEASGHSESQSEEKSKSIEKDIEDSQENTPSHSPTPSAPSFAMPIIGELIDELRVVRRTRPAFGENFSLTVYNP